MVLFDMVFVPPPEKIPLMIPALEVVVFEVALLILATVFPEIVIAPVPALYMPNAVWTLDDAAELTLILVAVDVLPMVLLLMIVAPDPVKFRIPQKLVALLTV